MTPAVKPGDIVCCTVGLKLTRDNDMPALPPTAMEPS